MAILYSENEVIHQNFIKKKADDATASSAFNLITSG
jgi:hypothetical protein